MIRLRIDGQEVEIDENTNLATSIGVADIQEPESSAAGYSKTAEIPFTPRNIRIFGFVNDLYSKEQFNNALHTAEYLDDDTVVMRGIAQIEKFTYKSGAQGQAISGAFHVSIVGAAFEWITGAKKKINELQSNESVSYTMADLYTNSIAQQESLIKFVPIDRGAFYESDEESDAVPRKMLNILDFHPFINVYELMNLVFGEFKIRTSQESLWKQLYFSGSFPETKDSTYVKEENDFLIGTSLSLTTDFRTNEQMNIFNDLDNKDAGYFSSGVIFPGTRAVPFSVYVPKDRITVKYKIELVYLAKISVGVLLPIYYADTMYFSSYDKFYFPVEASIEYQDRTDNIDNLTEEGRYCVKFEFEKGVSYQYIKLTFSKSVTTVSYVISTSNTLNKWITLYSRGEETVRIEVSNTSNATSSSWVDIKTIGGLKVTAFFIPHVGLTFSKTLYTNPYTADEHNTNRFDCLLQCSGNPSSSDFLFNVGAECALSPVFGNYIGIGDKVDISTVGGTALQIDFLSALRQMYNLMFYTNPITREVFIEPRTSFYNMKRKDIIDWRAKIDYSKSVEVQELGGEVGNALRLSYADGGDVVQRYNWKNRTDFGAWRVALLNKTSDEVKEITNPMFAPFLVRNIASVGMTLPQTESEKTQDRIEEVELDINPIIGCFAGVVDRTAGVDLEQWPKYPRLVFQDAGLNINLGFGDLSSASHTIPGLNQYYQDNISAYNSGRRITMYLKLNPQDVEALLMPNAQQRDLRGVFMIRHDGEDIPCLLEQISDYNAADGASTKCQFITDPNIRLTGDDTVVVTYGGKYIAYDNTAIEYYKKK